MEHSIRQYTTKKGFSLEYSIIGQGKSVLVLHGGHSNCEEEFGRKELVARGFTVITPSRPGYGRTSNELGKRIITACEAYIELLDELHISQTHVLAISAGGPSGIHIAARYPDRVKSLVLQSAVSQRWLSPGDKLHRSAQIMFRPSTEKYLWATMRLMNKFFPALLFNGMIASFSNLPKEIVLSQTSDEDMRQFKNMLNRQRSGHGFLIDVAQTGNDLAPMLAAIRCPTLIMHSTHDATVPVEHARNAHRQIPGSQLCELDSWGHLIWLGSDANEMYRKLFAFIGNQ